MWKITYPFLFYDKSIMTMRHIEMHLIENSADLQSASHAGLDVYDDDHCENCYRPVGDSRGDKAFVPFLVVLDDKAEWIVCRDCAEPVL